MWPKGIFKDAFVDARAGGLRRWESCKSHVWTLSQGPVAHGPMGALEATFMMLLGLRRKAIWEATIYGRSRRDLQRWILETTFGALGQELCGNQAHRAFEFWKQRSWTLKE